MRESLGPRTHLRRLQRRRRCFGRSGAGVAAHWYGRRRVDPHPVIVVWRLRHQADPWACTAVHETLGRLRRLAILVQAGPITRSVDDAGLLLDVIAGPADGDPFAIPASAESFRPLETDRLLLRPSRERLRVAWTADMGFAAVDPEVRDICAAAVRVFEELGCRIDEACRRSTAQRS